MPWLLPKAKEEGAQRLSVFPAFGGMRFILPVRRALHSPGRVPSGLRL